MLNICDIPKESKKYNSNIVSNVRLKSVPYEWRLNKLQTKAQFQNLFAGCGQSKHSLFLTSKLAVRRSDNFSMVTTHSRNQSFLSFRTYKIINQILNCKDNLYRFITFGQYICSVCKEVDVVKHNLFYCIDSKKFWLDLKSWMIANLNFGFEFTICEILFISPNHSVPEAEIIICLIFMGKLYLNNSKTKNKSWQSIVL